MTVRQALDAVFQQEGINFVLTNRIPRRLATRFMGWFSRIEHPVVRSASIAVLQLFAGDLHLEEARTTSFASMHDCFIRELKPGARPIDGGSNTLVSPCDAIVGASGRIVDGRLIQAKGFWYTLDELVADRRLADRYREGTYATLRLTASMYHRFHAPSDCDVESVHHIPGDTWNVNPVALKRVPRLFCRNERVVINARLHDTNEPITLVAVGAILVASIRLSFLDLAADDRSGPRIVRCRASFRRGEEMGYFEHGSTILVFGSRQLGLAPAVREGERMRMGEPLFVHS